MHLDIAETIEKIKSKLSSIQDDRKDRPYWSGLIKRVFVELAWADGFKACCSLSESDKALLIADEGKAPDWSEWLYDLVWYTSVMEPSGVERTTSIPLVLECEWDATLHAIALDFDKLLVANADLRVMVCGGYKNFLAKPIFEQCKRAVQSYQQGHIGDTFLVCIVPEDGEPECMEIVRR